jgi:hypothetical protein
MLKSPEGLPNFVGDTRCASRVTHNDAGCPGPKSLPGQRMLVIHAGTNSIHARVWCRFQLKGSTVQ